MGYREAIDRSRDRGGAIEIVHVSTAERDMILEVADAVRYIGERKWGVEGEGSAWRLALLVTR